MKTVDFSLVFRICKEGIYYVDGFLPFKGLTANENGYFGEERYEDGEFKIVFYSTEDTLVFPLSHFSKSENPLKEARAKCGSCALHLLEVAIPIKEYKI